MTAVKQTLPLGLVVAALLTSAPVRAQQLAPPEARQGYYMSTGAAAALNLNYDAQEEWLPGWPGYMTSFRFGQKVTEQFSLGISLDYGQSFGTLRQGLLSGLGFEVQWHPNAEWSLRAGLGLGVVGVSSDDEDDEVSGALGAAWSLALLYDWFPAYDGGSGGLSIRPLVQASFNPEPSFTSVIATVGVELAWWTGLPRDQLDLPMDAAYR